MKVLLSRKAKKDKTIFERGIEKLIVSNFKESGRFAVMSDIRQFKPSEDKYIFQQLNEKASESVSVYFNGEWLCDVTNDLRPEQALAVIQFALIQAMQKGRMFR